MKSKWMVIIVILLLVFGTLVLLSRKKMNQTPLEVKPDIQSAVFENGKIQPDTFDFSHQQNLVISAHAKDNDYTITIPDIGLTKTITRGETAEIDLSGLGVGTSSFSCGETCSGTITVQPDVDADK